MVLVLVFFFSSVTDVCCLAFVVLPLGETGSRHVPTGGGLGFQADRAISKARLHALLRFHMPPIDVVVYHGS